MTSVSREGTAQQLVADDASSLRKWGSESTEHREVAVPEPDKINDVEAVEATIMDAENTDDPLVDGDFRAWLQVVGSFLVFSNIWGFTFAFGMSDSKLCTVNYSHTTGVFESYYIITYLPETSASSISWIGTISNFLLIFGGILTGPLFDLGYFRTMLLAGAFIETLAVFLLSLCTKYWQVVLTQAIMIGLGDSLLYMPGLALVGRSFKKHRAAAMAVATCGAPIGGIVFTLVFQQLITRLSFGATVRVLGYIILGCYLVSFPLLLWGVHNLGSLAAGTTRKLFDRKAFMELPFVLYTASNFMVFFGYLVPFFFMSTYGQIALGMSSSAANSTIMITQATSIVGRLVAGYCAARIGGMIQWLICALGSGILCVAWSGIHSPATFYLFVALYGCFSGPLISLPPSAFAIVCPDVKVFGTRLGMASALGAFASLIGSPIAAALLPSGDTKNFLGLQLFAGLAMMIGGCLLICLWLVLIKGKGGTKLM